MPSSTYTPAVTQLMSLGKPDLLVEHPWPDYPALYGLTEGHVPELLAILADESLDELPEEDVRIWAVVHAWRALGQLGSDAAITQLVEQFERLCEDDVGQGEIPKVLGMIGKSAIPLLEYFWRHADVDEFARAMAMDALAEVVAHHPECRGAVLSIYRRYMQAPDLSAEIINGLLIINLLRLEAKEEIDGIRHMFALGCVDATYAGDLRDVEEELGVPHVEVTPIVRDDDEVDPLQEDEDLEDFDPDGAVSILDQAIRQYGGDFSVMGVSGLDGLIAALACAPRAIQPSEWFPALWGGPEEIPSWESKKQVESFTSTLFEYYNEVMSDFEFEDYRPLFMENPDDPSGVAVVEPWCEGFARGLSLWGELPDEDMNQLGKWIAPIWLFLSDDAEAERDALSDDELIALQESIQGNVARIRKHFFRPAPPAPSTVVRQTPKTGRNDPCPCGSGKKYKHCCALH